MKTLDEHNRAALEWRKMLMNPSYAAGVACPKCGAGMVETYPGSINTSQPPSTSVHCPKCKHSGLKF
jgi:DNA-directed RNA polymerase subunit RPC12/RpoP